MKPKSNSKPVPTVVVRHVSFMSGQDHDLTFVKTERQVTVTCANMFRMRISSNKRPGGFIAQVKYGMYLSSFDPFYVVHRTQELAYQAAMTSVTRDLARASAIHSDFEALLSTQRKIDRVTTFIVSSPDKKQFLCKGDGNSEYDVDFVTSHFHMATLFSSEGPAKETFTDKFTCKRKKFSVRHFLSEDSGASERRAAEKLYEFFKTCCVFEVNSTL